MACLSDCLFWLRKKADAREEKKNRKEESHILKHGIRPNSFVQHIVPERKAIGYRVQSWSTISISQFSFKNQQEHHIF